MNLGEIVRGRKHTARVFVEYAGERGGFGIDRVSTNLIGAEVRVAADCTLPRPGTSLVPLGMPTEATVSENIRIVELSLTPSSDAGDQIEGSIAVHTSVDGFELLSIPVKATLVQPVKAYPSILSFDDTATDVKTRQTVTMVSLLQEPFRILTVDPADSELQCSYTEKVVEDEAEIVVKATGACLVRLRKTGLQVRIRLMNSKEELSVPLELVPREVAYGQE